MLLHKISCTNITAHIVKSYQGSLSFIIHGACRHKEAEVRSHMPLDDIFNIFSLLQIILHIEQFPHLGSRPLALVCQGRISGILLVLKIVVAEVVVQLLLPCCFCLVMKLMQLTKTTLIWLHTLAPYCLDKDP